MGVTSETGGTGQTKPPGKQPNPGANLGGICAGFACSVVGGGPGRWCRCSTHSSGEAPRMQWSAPRDGLSCMVCLMIGKDCTLNLLGLFRFL